MEFRFKPIGFIHSRYKIKEGVPIQGVFHPESRGRAEIIEKYESGLKDIDGFSHLILLYVFHKSRGYDLIAKPFLDSQPRGVFSIRAPNRPNPIGLSVVRLEKRVRNVLYLAEVDILDGTPLLDIKPFSPRIDHREKVRTGWMEKAFSDEKHRTRADTRF